MKEDFSFVRSGLGCVAVRHAQVRQPIQRRAPDQDLSGLPREAPGGHAIAKDRLEPEHGRLRQAPPMVATFALPRRAADLANPAQILIPSQALSLGVPMLPNLGVVLRGNRGLRAPAPNRLVTAAPVICAIARHLRDRLV